ncbi:hypothetical protein ACJX0J_034278, partial [Zea mays]
LSEAYLFSTDKRFLSEAYLFSTSGDYYGVYYSKEYFRTRRLDVKVKEEKNDLYGRSVIFPFLLHKILPGVFLVARDTVSGSHLSMLCVVFDGLAYKTFPITVDFILG